MDVREIRPGAAAADTGARPSVDDIPAGAVTFLLTDIEGSTARWERAPAAMRRALARHDALLHEGLVAHGGVVLTERGEGDSFFALVAQASDALAAACAIQQALLAEPWPAEVAPLRVRMALHSGAAGMRAGADYRGPAPNRCARLRAVAHGGQILVSSATQALVREALPAELSLRDLGLHRLKDLLRPDRVYQLEHPGLPAEFPPLTSLDERLRHLPVQLTSLVGREREIAAVRALLLEEGTRLLTLVGPGGVGKSRLALQAAAEVVESFPDGVYFVNLAPITDPALVLPAIVQALGVTEQGSQPLLDALWARLSDTRTLLVVDNCEQVVEAAPDMAGLLDAGPRVAVLATSRAALHVRGERTYAVPPLTLPAAGTETGSGRGVPLETLTQAEAVRLFALRAREARADFALTHETAGTVAAICARLDGLPLAIELAATWVRLLSPAALLLTGGARDLPERQQTLRAALDWSHDLLTADEQALFARLAVFVGGCTLEVAEAVCAADGLDVLGSVEALARQSLLRLEDAGGGGEEGQPGDPRLALLETIREYALERLEVRGEAEAVRRRHAAHYLELAQQAAPAYGGVPDAVWLDRLEREHDNLRAALRWAHDHREAELEARLALALAEFWNARGHQREAREHLERLLGLQGSHGSAIPPNLHAGALWWLGAMIYFHGDYERAVTLWEDSVALWRALGDTRGVAQSLHGLGYVAGTRGDYQRADALYREYLAVARDSGDARETAIALLCLAEVACAQGDAAQVTRLCTESLPLCHEVDDQFWEGYALGWLGLAAWLQQDIPRASAFFTDSLALFRESTFPVGVAWVLTHMGRLAREQDAEEEAGAAFRESLALIRILGVMPAAPDALEGLAGVAAARQQAERAARLFGAAEALRVGKRIPRWPVHQALYERDVAAIRAALGEEGFATAWAAGRALSLEQAISRAMEDGQGA